MSIVGTGARGAYKVTNFAAREVVGTAVGKVVPFYGETRAVIGATSSAIGIIHREGFSRSGVVGVGREFGEIGGKIGVGTAAGMGAGAVTSGASPFVQVPAALVAKELGGAAGGAAGRTIGGFAAGIAYDAGSAMSRLVRRSGAE